MVTVDTPRSVLVESYPPMPGGHYLFLANERGEVTDVIPGA